MNDPVGNGWCGFPVGISIMVGARIVLALLSIFRGQNHALMMGSSCLMTAGTEALAGLDRDNLQVAYGLFVFAGLGIGGTIVPASIMTTIICHDDLITTVAALTFSIRVVAGAIGHTTYYNALYSKALPLLTTAGVEAAREQACSTSLRSRILEPCSLCRSTRRYCLLLAGCRRNRI
jgi:hypothetical protein